MQAASVSRRTTIRTLVILAVPALMALGCGERPGGIDPDNVRVYRIPFLRPDAARDSTLCMVSVPADYEPDRSWPLLIALHGYGSSAARFHTVWHEAAATSGFVLLTPQGEERTEEGVGWSWGESAEEIVRLSMEAVLGSVRIDRSRIFLTGFSQGGWLTYEIAMKQPHLFRGIAPIGAGRAIPRREQLGRLAGLRVYLGHGEFEPRLQEVRRLAARLDSLGCSVMLREYPATGHGLPDSATAELKQALEFLGGGD
jgi:phospholipase/carboxylesterase